MMSGPAQQQFRLGGLSSYVNRVMARLAAAPGERELLELHRSLDSTARRLGVSMSLKNLSAAQLTATTRGLYGWTAFFADEEDLRGYVAAVRAAGAALDDAAARAGRWRRPLVIQFRPMRGMYQVRQTRGGTSGAVVSFPTPAVCFSAADFEVAGRAIFAGDAAAKRLLLHRMQAEDFTAIAAEIDALGGAVDEGRGRVHDLAESFERVNAQYFAASPVKRPKLYWSRSLTRRKLGHYDWVGDAIMISRTLDAAEVPAFVVDFVMYHEMLHKAHGLRWSGERGYAHTAEFYRDERRFGRHGEAERVLGRLARMRD